MIDANKAISDVIDERQRQNEKWGPMHHPDGTSAWNESIRDDSRLFCDIAHRGGYGTWADILKEEFWEALSETNQTALRKELVQVAAVCVAWIEDIDGREE